MRKDSSGCCGKDLAGSPMVPGRAGTSVVGPIPCIHPTIPAYFGSRMPDQAGSRFGRTVDQAGKTVPVLVGKKIVREPFKSILEAAKKTGQPLFFWYGPEGRWCFPTGEVLTVDGQEVPE